MKCFTHRDSDAIAICRSCGRALCVACIAEVGRSCACKGRCESDVERFNEMLSRDRSGPPTPASIVGYDRVIFLMIIGVGFVWFGFYFFAGQIQRWFFAALGGAFFIFGVSQFFMTKRIRKQLGEKKR